MIKLSPSTSGVLAECYELKSQPTVNLLTNWGPTFNLPPSLQLIIPSGWSPTQLLDFTIFAHDTVKLSSHTSGVLVEYDEPKNQPTNPLNNHGRLLLMAQARQKI